MNKFQKLAVLEKRLAYVFNQKALLTQALTHKSADAKHNERLEFLGDAILNCVIAAELYQRFPKATEGELTRSRASLVNKKTLAELATELTLDDFIQLGIGEKKSGGHRRSSILADACEAIVGAIYSDGGYSACQEVLGKWYAKRLVDVQPKNQEKDPKTYLQEWLQAQHHDLPDYTIIKITGDPHDQEFTVSCELAFLELKTEGVGPSRRSAEQEAARRILERLFK